MKANKSWAMSSKRNQNLNQSQGIWKSIKSPFEKKVITASSNQSWWMSKTKSKVLDSYMNELKWVQCSNNT